MTSPGRYSNDLGGRLAPSVLFGFLSGEEGQVQNVFRRFGYG